MNAAADHPYARAQGKVSRSAATAAILAMAAAAAIYVPAAAVPLGLVASAAGLQALYEIATRGTRGAFMAKSAVAAGLIVAAGSFMWAAQREGAIDLSGLSQAFFRRDIIATMWPAFLRAALRTIHLAAVSEVLGVMLGLALSVLAISPKSWLRFPAKSYIDFFRGTPLLMQLLVISFGLPYIGIVLEPFTAGIIGLTLNSAAYVAEIFRAGIQSIERGQMDAARSLGMPNATAMLFVVIPQAVRRVIPPLMNEFIALLKDSSLVAVLGATIAERELLKVARDGAAFYVSATPFVVASICYLALTIPLTRVVSRLEDRLREGQA